MSPLIPGARLEMLRKRQAPRFLELLLAPLNLCLLNLVQILLPPRQNLRSPERLARLPKASLILQFQLASGLGRVQAQKTPLIPQKGCPLALLQHQEKPPWGPGNRARLRSTLRQRSQPTGLILRKDELSKELTSEDQFSADEKRSLWSSWFAKREDKCGGYKYTFEWTGEDGKNDCLEDCIGAFGQVSAVCALVGEDGIYAEGDVDVGCGKYSYWIEEEDDDDDPEPTTTQKEEEEPTESATPLESSYPVCNDAADFQGHADIHKSSVESTAEQLCQRHPITVPSDGKWRRFMPLGVFQRLGWMQV